MEYNYYLFKYFIMSPQGGLMSPQGGLMSPPYILRTTRNAF